MIDGNSIRPDCGSFVHLPRRFSEEGFGEGECRGEVVAWQAFCGLLGFGVQGAQAFHDFRIKVVKCW